MFRVHRCRYVGALEAHLGIEPTAQHTRPRRRVRQPQEPVADLRKQLPDRLYMLLQNPLRLGPSRLTTRTSSRFLTAWLAAMHCGAR